MATGWGRRVRVEMQKCAINQTPTTQVPTHVSLSTSLIADDGSSNGEPTVTNGYARQSIAFNTLTVYTSLTVDTASNATNNATITFGPSTGGGFSTGASNLQSVGVWNASTGTAETVFCGRATIAGGGFAVNAAGVSISFAANTGIVLGCISA